MDEGLDAFGVSQLFEGEMSYTMQVLGLGQKPTRVRVLFVQPVRLGLGLRLIPFIFGPNLINFLGFN